MPRYFYHGTTKQGYEAIQKAGYIMPQSGDTYTDKVFLAGNDSYARKITFLKHAEYQGQEIVVYRIPKYVLKKKFLGDGSKHISNMLTLGDKTWTYSKPIQLTNEIDVASAPYYLHLPEGVSIAREGKGTGFAFTKEAAEKWLTE
jgi:hypothetical protein